MSTISLTRSFEFASLIHWPERLGGAVMRMTRAVMKRQVVAAALLSAIAIAAMAAASNHVNAADLSVDAQGPVQVISACAEPQEDVILYDKRGHPTVPARTPYYYCVTGTTVVPGQIPPPPEYCCH